MRTHILGIGGTFMGSLAVLAKNLGYQVSGSDQQIYPPMSTQLAEQEITLLPEQALFELDPKPDQIVVGNVMRRGMPVIETLINQKIPLISGPQWLAEHILCKQWVLAVSGTHGKTTTASILAWILEYAGLSPGFLIGGVPINFGISAKIGRGRFFVVEADEYDSAFFDKRSKFVHYWPKTLIMNNLEFDHSDIFKDLSAIQQQFHHLIRTVASQGCIIWNETVDSIRSILAQGCWSQQQTFGGSTSDWTLDLDRVVRFRKQTIGKLQWPLIGEHNHLNALSAIAAAVQVGVAPEVALRALEDFKGVKRRLEYRGEVAGIRVYDDFAHHPTAIKMTISALKQAKKPDQRLIALVDIRSNTMRSGEHRDQLFDAVAKADRVYFFYYDNVKWDVTCLCQENNPPIVAFRSIDQLLSSVLGELEPGDRVLCMSNGSFENVHEKLLDGLTEKV